MKETSIGLKEIVVCVRESDLNLKEKCPLQLH